MRPIGSLKIDEDERLDLANCPSCGSTLWISVSRLSSSGTWRVVRVRTT
jgi:hypothetical protein